MAGFEFYYYFSFMFANIGYFGNWHRYHEFSLFLYGGMGWELGHIWVISWFRIWVDCFVYYYMALWDAWIHMRMITVHETAGQCLLIYTS